MTLLAGAAVVDITPPVGVMMDGYGGRTTPSQGVHDPLMARVLVLDHDGTRVAIVSCDLLGMHREITAAIRERAAASCGIDPDGVVVAAMHNHAGPIGLRGGMFSRVDPELAAAFVDSVCVALEEATAALRPATLKLGRGSVESVSMNRRDPEGPIDPLMRMLLVEGEDGPIASILNFSCHATVLNGANLELTGEFVGVAARLVHEQTGAPCIYLNGACGDVNPTWIKQDFASVERVGRIVGGEALRAIGELQTVGVGQRAHNIRWDEFPEKAVFGKVVEPRLRVARREIDLAWRRFEEDEKYADLIEKFRAEAEATPPESDARRAAMAQLSRWQSERWAAVWARRTGETSQRTEVQVLGHRRGVRDPGAAGGVLRGHRARRSASGRASSTSSSRATRTTTSATSCRRTSTRRAATSRGSPSFRRRLRV